MVFLIHSYPPLPCHAAMVSHKNKIKLFCVLIIYSQHRKTGKGSRSSSREYQTKYSWGCQLYSVAGICYIKDTHLHFFEPVLVCSNANNQNTSPWFIDLLSNLVLMQNSAKHLYYYLLLCDNSFMSFMYSLLCVKIRMVMIINYYIVHSFIGQITICIYMYVKMYVLYKICI